MLIWLMLTLHIFFLYPFHFFYFFNTFSIYFSIFLSPLLFYSDNYGYLTLPKFSDRYRYVSANSADQDQSALSNSFNHNIHLRRKEI